MKCVLFDLDGTLTDPAEGIINSILYALSHFGFSVSCREELFPFIGPPLVDSFIKKFGVDNDMAEAMLASYREYFGTKGMFENVVYNGVPEMLKCLRQNGIKIVLATSKPDIYAIEILKHFELFDYFDFLACATMDETRNTKDAVIKYGLENLNFKKDECIMVGDRRYDISGAHQNGLKAVGVLYGYGDKTEHTKACSDYTVSTVSELTQLLLSL